MTNSWWLNSHCAAACSFQANKRTVLELGSNWRSSNNRITPSCPIFSGSLGSFGKKVWYLQDSLSRICASLNSKPQYLVSVIKLLQLFSIHSSSWLPGTMVQCCFFFYKMLLPVVCFWISKIVVQGNIQLPIMLCQTVEGCLFPSLQMKIKNSVRKLIALFSMLIVLKPAWE